MYDETRSVCIRMLLNHPKGKYTLIPRPRNLWGGGGYGARWYWLILAPMRDRYQKIPEKYHKNNPTIYKGFEFHINLSSLPTVMFLTK